MAGVTVSGVNELYRQLTALPDRLARAALENAVVAGAEIVRDRARQRAPRDTGKLAGHIELRVAKRTPRQVVVEVGPDDEAYYGLFVEYGHAIVRGKKVVGHVPPRPFLRPAYDESREAVEAAMMGRLKDEIEKAAKP